MTPQTQMKLLIDLFSLYVLFSHFRPRDATRGNSFFQMSSYARANVRMTNEKNKRQIPMKASRGLKWENKMCKLKRSIESIERGNCQELSINLSQNISMSLFSSLCMTSNMLSNSAP